MQPRSSQRPALRIEWHGSPRLALALGLAHALSVAAASSAIEPGWISALCVAGLLASAAFYVQRTLSPAAPLLFANTLASRRIAALELKVEDTGAARTLDGRWHDARLSPVFAAALLTIIRVKLEGARLPQFVVLMPDMLAPEDYRRLLVRLRWG
jgi:hypothetical protein